MGGRTGRKPNRTVVLDCSVVMAWFFADEKDPLADALQDTLPALELVVPALFPFEVANALLTGERKNRTTEARSSHFLTLLSALPIAVDAPPALSVSDLLRIGRAHGLSAYDASYLELAARTGTQLATLDGPLRQAAGSIGVRLFGS